MDIQALDYNTQREPLVMPVYGREIQKMVELAISLPDRAQRLTCAKSIIRQMENKNPQVREHANYQQTLWDHLYLMSRKRLDIDWPYDISGAERILTKPQPMPLPGADGQPPVRHYGRLVTQLFDKLKEMEPGRERDELTRLTANQMKRDLAEWGHGVMDDERVASDLARYTGGEIQIDLATLRLVKLSAGNGNEHAGKRGKRKK